MSGPLGSKEIPSIDKKEYIRLDSNNKITLRPDPRLFASFLNINNSITEEERLASKQLIIDLIKDTFVNKETLQNYTLNTELAKYQPVGNYVIQDELKNYAFKTDLQNYQQKDDFITQSEAAIKYQTKDQYALISDLSRYQLNTPATPQQLPIPIPQPQSQSQPQPQPPVTNYN